MQHCSNIQKNNLSTFVWISLGEGGGGSWVGVGGRWVCAMNVKIVFLSNQKKSKHN